MINLVCWRLVTNRANKAILVHPTTIAQWKNEHDFGFDIFESRNWSKFLATHRVNGKLLPTASKDGDPLRYEVYIWGSATWMREYMVCGKHPFGYYSLYPAYDKDGKKLSTLKYGVVQR